MFNPRSIALAATVLAGGFVLATAGVAKASGVDPELFAPNYTFPNGSLGFELVSHGGPINPGVIVGFNPQPDPPGDGDNGALIALLHPADPELISPSLGGAFTFTLALQGLGDGSVIPLPGAPNSDGFTSLRDEIDGHVISITLQFGPDQVNPETWGGFNPQPIPPGDVLDGSFQFASNVDPYMGFQIDVDGAPLSFSLAPGVPEPQAWALMLLGFGGAGGVLRSRRRRRTATAVA
ncbi:PEPxxWA-CTERM sorting domain-containing protein [Phenylobacterium sp.]|uniref:PEPxxWA-CTERM sorting domain-containing protein n=1 Tax=Phenylobacterium sp. TaxID=1871053 RepID=UPI00121CC8E6|nr:PEPxxWA-CTERM sorting domain-containing protein [Phenylobacterium sp.]THD67295.1 MAG: PEP-CTERM sorting domain-containing protein [Phenylobacterium sp.]